ncbi:endonuclease IV, apurinic endonuclease [Mycoplasma wenyonii str. Massachusetts]|uniref:Probable endonuclease 4 n=1 Tax=Mycoplasma wenyonii (strain Massachusetts) TaxID=1197325 RepID=I6YM89_MYCWM|nr:deoxyribonuclease IV [Mycoplasma wenyonii]AFN65424.1 endonuclease IV, apurinic endonuclease [Mycoplasma wenyonii str. Massachusetts]
MSNNRSSRVEERVNKQLILGSHISLNKPNNYLLGTVRETIYNGADCFMIFTGPPQNQRRVPVEQLFLAEGLEEAKKANISFQNCVVHAPYIFNLAQKDEDGFIHSLVVNEIQRTVQMGIQIFVVHPGFAIGERKEGIQEIIKNLKGILKTTEHLNYFFALETMAGKKNQLGSSLEELKEIFEGCNWNSKLAVCLDTVHLHDSGYDLSDLEGFKKHLDSLIGLERVKTLHLGDSMNVRGSKKDRHANLNYGHIGFETLIKWAYDEFFSTLPIIVETPFWVKQKGKKKELVSPYKWEIQLIRNKLWKPIPNPEHKPIYSRYEQE